MTIIEKLKVCIATIGKLETGKKLGMWPNTLRARMADPGSIKLSEVDAIEALYQEIRQQ